MDIPKIPEIGFNVGRWAVKGPPKSGRKMYFTLECSCGNVREVRWDSVMTGDSRSCGCLAKEIMSEAVKTHGLTNHPLYNVWMDMNRRCFKKERKDYKHYGGRGITVDDRWVGDEGIVNFLIDMYPSHRDGLELDRIDNDGNYTKDNCKWSTRSEQSLNRRPSVDRGSPVTIKYDGKILRADQWEDITGIPKENINERLRLGWSVERALTTKLRPRKIRVRLGDESLETAEMFKNPVTFYNKVLNSNLSTLEFLFAAFGGKIKVEYYNSKKWREFFSKDLVEVVVDMEGVELTDVMNNLLKVE